MARQAASAKMGFYPIDPFCMDGIIGHLALSTKDGSKGVHIIDPCCGKGAALRQLATGLGVPMDQVYGIELDGDRVKEAKALMPDAKILGPASFFGVKATGHSFSLAYINPPFDFELGGGEREELNFAEEAWRLLASGGVMVLVCPLGALNANRGFCEYIDSRFEDVRLFSMPRGISATTGYEYGQYKEIVVIGRKRRVILTEDAIKLYGALHQAQFEWMDRMPWCTTLTKINNMKTYERHIKGKVFEKVAPLIYTLPPTWKPMTFYKSEYLPEELELALEGSPLNRLTNAAETFELARPPIAPGKGHIALLIASGILDGIVDDDEAGGEPHVIRGSTKKVEYWNESASKSEVNPETGALTTKDVYSQKPVCVIRAAWQDGTILTLSDQPPEPTEAQAAPESNESKGLRNFGLDSLPKMPVPDGVKVTTFDFFGAEMRSGSTEAMAAMMLDKVRSNAGDAAPWER